MGARCVRSVQTGCERKHVHPDPSIDWPTALRYFKELTITRADTEDVDFLPMMAALCWNSSITSVQLKSCSLAAVGALAAAVAAHTAIRTLTISDARCWGGAAATLAGVLLTNTKLHTLRVIECHIDKEGIIALARALRTNTTLRVLSLEGNHIHTDAIRELAEMLEVNTTLAHLNLCRCGLGLSHTKLLVEALQANQCVTVHGLGDNWPALSEPLCEALTATAAAAPSQKKQV